MLKYVTQTQCVLPMHSVADVNAMDVQIRSLFRTEPLAACHAFVSADYLRFRRHCLNVIRGQSVSNTSIASLNDGYRLQHVNGSVVVSRMMFVVMDDDGTAPQ